MQPVLQAEQQRLSSIRLLARANIKAGPDSPIASAMLE